MSGQLPDYYFRVRENGALMFRVDTKNRQRRIEMDQIAVVNIRNGEIKPQGDRVLNERDLEVIRIRPVKARFQAFSGCQCHGMSSSMRLIL